MREAATIYDVQPNEAGMRVDAFLAGRDLGLTRSQAEKLVAAGGVRVGGKPARPGQRLEAGDRVEVDAAADTAAPDVVPFEIVFEDDHLLVIAKPQGLVVHPAPGHRTGTLSDVLAARYPGLANVGLPGRPGIVHRLDRDTSGLMAVARTPAAYEDLALQVRERELERRYLALAWGELQEDRLIIEVPLARRLRGPGRMTAVPGPIGAPGVKSAKTEIRVLERLGTMTLVEARIATGRTHQIRVHLAHQGHPVVGDPLYGVRRAKQEKLALDEETLFLVKSLPGQALHAQTLTLRHPVGGQTLSFSVPPPREMSDLLAHLKAIAAG